MPLYLRLSHLKTSLLRNKKYTVEKNAELAQAVSDALEEQTAQEISVSLMVSDWKNDGGNSSEYPYYQDIMTEKITENDRADVIILPDSLSTAQDCNFCPVTETLNGKVRVRAASVPAKTVNITVWI